jgi:anion-transporting  ArsA/GET3 family ATPase
MKKAIPLLLIIIVLGGLNSAALSQNLTFTEVLKKHMNETVQMVKTTYDPAEKRGLMNDSFEKMKMAVDKAMEQADESQSANLMLLREQLTERSNQLNGLEGFEEIADEDLDDFSDYSQQMMEQANRTVTLSLTTALLIVIILLLL